jgi:hypothetical protein
MTGSSDWLGPPV